MVKTALTAPDGPPSDVEEIKEKSDYLRGTLKEVMLDPTPESPGQEALQELEAESEQLHGHDPAELGFSDPDDHVGLERMAVEQRRRAVARRADDGVRARADVAVERHIRGQADRGHARQFACLDHQTVPECGDRRRIGRAVIAPPHGRLIGR